MRKSVLFSKASEAKGPQPHNTKEFPGDGIVNHFAVICGIEDHEGICCDLNYSADDANDIFHALIV